MAKLPRLGRPRLSEDPPGLGFGDIDPDSPFPDAWIAYGLPYDLWQARLLLSGDEFKVAGFIAVRTGATHVESADDALFGVMTEDVMLHTGLSLEAVCSAYYELGEHDLWLSWRSGGQTIVGLPCAREAAIEALVWHQLGGTRAAIYRLRDRLLAHRHGEQCLACGRTAKLHIDHVIPRALGGPDVTRNP